MVLGCKKFENHCTRSSFDIKNTSGNFQASSVLAFLRTSTVDDDVERERNTLMSYTGHSAQRCFKSDTPFVLFLAPHVLTRDPVSSMCDWVHWFQVCRVITLSFRCVFIVLSWFPVWCYTSSSLLCCATWVFLPALCFHMDVSLKTYFEFYFSFPGFSLLSVAATVTTAWKFQVYLVRP